jgi:hypothetical protein
MALIRHFDVLHSNSPGDSLMNLTTLGWIIALGLWF